MSSVAARESLQTLRQRIAGLERRGPEEPRCLPLGVPEVDRVLAGGLAFGALHEVVAAAPAHVGSGIGFVLAIAALASGGNGHALWVQTDFACQEAGQLYGPGLDAIGFPMHRLIVLRVPHARDAAWAMEEALKSRAVGVVIGEFMTARPLDGTVLRRFSLVAGEGGSLGLLLFHRSSLPPSPALTRWEVASAPGERDAFGGLGRPVLALSLLRNRRGPTGRWLLSWNPHERIFTSAPLSLDLAAAARDGSPRAPLARAG